MGLFFLLGTSESCPWKTCQAENVQYFLGGGAANWTSAKFACELAGGHLAMPQGTIQDNCISTLMEEAEEDESWIGIYSKNAWDAPFRYVHNNEKVRESDFTNWTTSEVNLNKRCVAAGKENDTTGWHIGLCSSSKSYVCESRSGGTKF